MKGDMIIKIRKRLHRKSRECEYSLKRYFVKFRILKGGTLKIYKHTDRLYKQTDRWSVLGIS